MREIKFRMFALDLQKMFEMDRLHLPCTTNPNPASVYMQYTGLKDKNGKEIYEGDIIVYEIDNGVGIESYCAQVFWSGTKDRYRDRFEWMIEYADFDGFDSLSRPAVYNEELEVIGNIYENPEFLEVNS